MLILSRRCGQSIIIGDDVEVVVVGITDGKVRLGVAGPARVPVHQRERYDMRRAQPPITVATDAVQPHVIRCSDEATVS